MKKKPFLCEGQCLGPVLGTEFEENPNDCLDLCQSTDGCEWFSYHTDDSACILTTECQFVDETCIGTCFYGDKACEPKPLGRFKLKMINNMINIVKIYSLVQNKNPC